MFQTRTQRARSLVKEINKQLNKMEKDALLPAENPIKENLEQLRSILEAVESQRQQSGSTTSGGNFWEDIIERISDNDPYGYGSKVKQLSQKYKRESEQLKRQATQNRQAGRSTLSLAATPAGQSMLNIPHSAGGANNFSAPDLRLPSQPQNAQSFGIGQHIVPQGHLTTYGNDDSNQPQPHHLAGGNQFAGPSAHVAQPYIPQATSLPSPPRNPGEGSHPRRRVPPHRAESHRSPRGRGQPSAPAQNLSQGSAQPPAAQVTPPVSGLEPPRFSHESMLNTFGQTRRLSSGLPTAQYQTQGPAPQNWNQGTTAQYQTQGPVPQNWNQGLTAQYGDQRPTPQYPGQHQHQASVASTATQSSGATSYHSAQSSTQRPSTDSNYSAQSGAGRPSTDSRYYSNNPYDNNQ